MSSLKVGIVGLPNVGKSTLFNALLKKRVALSANYPFATVEPNVGVVAVSDSRLQVLGELVQREESMNEKPPIVPAAVEFVDIAGLVKGASTGEGLGNQFLSHIREVDAIVHVIRDFEDPNVIRAGGSVNPKEDKELIETELQLADIDKVDKLSTKPVLYVLNVDEAHLEGEKNALTPSRWNEIRICAKLEEELADLTEEERLEYLKSVGLRETGLERLIKAAYKLLGLISFLTAGPKEVRAWTIKSGTNAKEASGVIHTDFIKNFIRAQVINCDELLVHGSWSKAKEAGKVRTEGKDYVIQDGDVVEFLVGS
ncbi:MAG: redox-regulated ATPase YchF [Candidatus Daviesbacteria bacterium]|nr:redox-regulated ATPase YchF [Candidatus Daviesbacteria bacterium]